MMNELSPDVAAGFKEARHTHPTHPTHPTRPLPLGTGPSRSLDAPSSPTPTPYPPSTSPQACFAIFGGGPYISEIQLAAQGKRLVDALELMGVLAKVRPAPLRPQDHPSVD